MKCLLLIPALALVGCASAARVEAERPQYCHTSQTIKTTNGERVESRSVIECTDDQVKRLFQARSGMAATCGEFLYHMQLGGKLVQKKGISCQKPDGSWEIVDTSY
jgi:hypothetical protein